MEQIQAHVAQYKKEIVNKLVDLINQYSIIGVVNMENLPAPQLQAMRAQLRGNFHITMTKRRLIKIAFENTKSTKQGIEKLEECLSGMPALIFTKEKIIGELALAGIKAGVEGGKVAIKEDAIVVKTGEKIKPRVAEILIRLGIQPMEVGLDLVAVFENGLVYTKNILSIDESEYKNRITMASRWAFNIANYIAYPTKETISLLIGNAYKDAKALGISQNIFGKDIIEILLSKAEQQMLSLKTMANIQIVEKEQKEATEKQEAKHEIQPVAKTEIAEQKQESTEIRVPTREELEANIRMREKQREVKEVEKIYHDIHKKTIEEQDKKDKN
ncbi:50S ribosomal protein L10 [Candidatus Woesearchaeota archaeon]|nr:50S ribosomal protein L10 [Candidatus Woesearchaeota archaeon]